MVSYIKSYLRLLGLSVWLMYLWDRVFGDLVLNFTKCRINFQQHKDPIPAVEFFKPGCSLPKTLSSESFCFSSCSLPPFPIILYIGFSEPSRRQRSFEFNWGERAPTRTQHIITSRQGGDEAKYACSCIILSGAPSHRPVQEKATTWGHYGDALNEVGRHAKLTALDLGVLEVFRHHRVWRPWQPRIHTHVYLATSMPPLAGRGLFNAVMH